MDAAMTLKLPSALKQAIDETARREGTTAESLATEVLRERFTPEEGSLSVGEDGGTLADRLAYYIGAVDSSEYVADDARRSGSEYGRRLLDRHLEGYP
jgi:predicted transcriptional regulator